MQRSDGLLRRDLSLHWLSRAAVHRVRIAALTMAVLGAQCIALSDFRLSVPAAFLLVSWAVVEFTLRWMSE